MVAFRLRRARVMFYGLWSQPMRVSASPLCSLAYLHGALVLGPCAGIRACAISGCNVGLEVACVYIENSQVHCQISLVGVWKVFYIENN